MCVGGVVQKCMIEESCDCCVCMSVVACVIPLCREIFLFANLHEFRGQPVGFEGQGALSCLNRICAEREKKKNNRS